MRSKRCILALVLALPVLAGCGGAEAIAPGAAQSLQQQVRNLAAITQEGNLELAVGRAEALKAEVQQAETSGEVTPGRAERIQQNIDAFIESLQPAEVPPSTAPAAPSSEPAPAPPPPTFTAPAKGLLEDSRDPGETQTDRDRERAEEVAEELQEQAEKQEKEKQKQEEKNRGDD